MNPIQPWKPFGDEQLGQQYIPAAAGGWFTLRITASCGSRSFPGAFPGSSSMWRVELRATKSLTSLEESQPQHVRATAPCTARYLPLAPSRPRPDPHALPLILSGICPLSLRLRDPIGHRRTRDSNVDNKMEICARKRYTCSHIATQRPTTSCSHWHAVKLCRDRRHCRTRRPS